MTIPTTKILTRADVGALATIEMAIAAVERAFVAHATGAARMPVKVYLDLPEQHGDFRAMPAVMGDTAGVKWVNSHPENPKRFGLPSVMGVYVLSDAASARPLAVMDATLLTALRTGAAAGVATRALAAKAPRTLGFVGCGVQARHFLAAHRAIYGAKLELVCADANAEAAAAFAKESGGRAGSVEAAAGCDVVCTATPSRTPVVRLGWVKPGAHVNAMGADAPGKQELETELTVSARVFVDDLEQASESGEVNVPLHHGDLARDELAGTLGQVLAGKVAARERADEITVFDSTGLAIQDVALARAVYDEAVRRGVGMDVALVD
jgi:ornithine cyclodeaminase/alanine dehydrogenase